MRENKVGVFIRQGARGRVRKRAMIIAASLFVLAAGVLILSSCSSGEDELPVEELPSFVYNSAEVLQAYQTAMQIPEILPLMPCYCNCGEAHGHRSLEDCFFNEDGSLNDHGAFCEICDLEVADIAKGREEGLSLERIRELIDETYISWGRPTDTPALS